MPKKLDINIVESKKELQKILLKQPSLVKRCRVKMLLLIKDGKVEFTTELSQKIKYSTRTIYNWLNDYKTGGITQLLELKAGGNVRKVLTEAMKEGIKEKLEDPENGLVSYVALQDWVEHTYGQTIAYTTLYDYCRKHLGSKLKTPRKSHVKKDEQVVETFLKTA